VSDDLVKRLRNKVEASRIYDDDEELLDEAADRIEALENLFPAILEYLEQEADVVDGDNGVPYPNAAMSLLVWTRHALGEKKDGNV